MTPAIPGIRQRRRPLEHTLPQRQATLLIRLRRWWQPRAKAAQNAIDHFMVGMAYWFAGMLALMTYLFVCAWLDLRDARVSAFGLESEASALQTEISSMRHETLTLQAKLAQMVAAQKSPIFYVVEGGDIAVVQEKMNLLARRISGEAYELGEHKKP